MQYLRETANQVTWVPDFALPIFDPGFRGPGKAQFLAALDHYQPGVPRDFDEPSCFYCGKVEVDIGKALTECGTCKMAWYCDKVSRCFYYSPNSPLMHSGFRTARQHAGMTISRTAHARRMDV